jgi:hypothetical protein
MHGLPVLPLVILATGVFDFLAALGIYLFLQRLERKADEVRRKWRPTPVKILSSRVIEKAGRQATLYSAEVLYEYTVEGTRYEGDRISVYPDWSSSSRSRHQELATEFPAGREVSGWVNPWNPKEAVLSVTARSSTVLRYVPLILVASGIATLVIGAVAWISRWGAPT